MNRPQKTNTLREEFLVSIFYRSNGNAMMHFPVNPNIWPYDSLHTGPKTYKESIDYFVPPTSGGHNCCVKAPPRNDKQR